MIEIISYYPFKPKDGSVSSLKGFVKLKLQTHWGNLTCMDLQIFSKGGKNWVNFPAKKIEGSEGTKYLNYCLFESQDEGNRFSEAVINKVKEWHVANQSQPANKKTESEPVSMSPVMGMKKKEDVPF